MRGGISLKPICAPAHNAPASADFMMFSGISATSPNFVRIPTACCAIAIFRTPLTPYLRRWWRGGKGLEVNTNGLYMTPSVMPELPIVRRFLELGGEIVTIGSDAHYPEAVGHAVEETLDALKSIGLKYICAYDNRQPRFIPIP